MVTSEEMAILDQAAERLGLPRCLLMENAGSAVARRIVERFGRPRTLILAGTGNNGGDGMVAARHLSNFGCEVHLILVGEPEVIRTEESRLNWRVLQNLKSVSLEELSSLDEELGWAEVVVDAILGTGVKGELREPVLSVVRRVNSCGKPVVAVDTPTGLDPSTGRICGEAVRARLTVTFHARKKGHEGREDYTGEVLVEDIGIPRELELQILGRKLEPPVPPSPVLVSACLLGVNCRYDGRNSLSSEVLSLVRDRKVILACPEIFGGLPTPRHPNYLRGGAGKEVLEGRARVFNAKGEDVTENFIKGAFETLSLARRMGASQAILKSGSPSCGVGWVEALGGRMEGDGVTAALLRREGLELKTEGSL